MRRPLLVGLLALVVALLLALWTQRRPIANSYIERELARRGVQARYEIEKIGINRQRLTNVVIGDPARPDLFARVVEVRLGWSLAGPRLVAVKARGVRLLGRLEGGKLRLGQVDRLLGPPGKAPFRLPDLDVDLSDVGIGLVTPAGPIGLGVEGKGKLSDGFRGKLAVAAHRLAPGDCRVEDLRAAFALDVADLRPHVVGPASVASLGCGASLAAARSRADLDVRLEPALDGWRGHGAVELAGLKAAGNRADRLSGRMSFAGTARETKGQTALAADGFASSLASAASLSVEGPYAWTGARLSFAGNAVARDLTLSERSLAPLTGALAGLGSTPVGPVAIAWSAALVRAARGGLAGQAGLHLAVEGASGAIRLDKIETQARSGGHLALSGGDGLTLFLPSGATRVDGRLELSGGGLPEARFALSQAAPGAPLSGSGRISPVSVGGARLALGEIRFGPAGSSTRIETLATLDGPLGGGRVAGLVVPVRARIDSGGGFAIGESCTPIAFRALEIGSFRLGRTRLPLCPTGRALVWKGKGGAVAGGAGLADLRLAGMLGSAPVTIAAGKARFDLARSALAASGVAIRFGRPDAVNRLDMAELDGRFQGGGVTGRFAGLSGKLAAVALNVGEGKGEWRFGGNQLDASGALILADASVPIRFHPLASRDFHLALADNRIAAGGTLEDPKTLTRIAVVDIRHDLASGAGSARLDVPGIKFDPAFQPDQLTPVTVGVVALVNGVVKGRGEIAWDSSGTRSSGIFSTEKMNLAASFGPVEGLSTTIHFSDLLALATPPGQVATAKLIQAGVDVFDGRVQFQLLPEQKVKVEEGHWPFAGGDLLLEPTLLDFSHPAPRHLTFRVAGMDIASFVQQMKFSNISATGTFDGVVPMIFDERGGRIEGGHLVARDPGGTLSYIGELTDRELGAYGKLAFDALKSLRYSRLIVDLNGSLEGEFVAGIKLDGIARDVAAAPAPKGGISAMVVGRALGQLAKIPFKFNITARGPFRALIGTARSLNDPTNLIQSVLPEMLRDKPTTTVQPKESEPVR